MDKPCQENHTKIVNSTAVTSAPPSPYPILSWKVLIENNIETGEGGQMVCLQLTALGRVIFLRVLSMIVANLVFLVHTKTVVDPRFFPLIYVQCALPLVSEMYLFEHYIYIVWVGVLLASCFGGNFNGIRLAVMCATHILGTLLINFTLAQKFHPMLSVSCDVQGMRDL